MQEKIGAQPGPQTTFLSTTADIGIFGGSAGGGKTFALLLESLRHVTTNPLFSALFLRRTTPQIFNPGGLWDTAADLYSKVGGKPKVGLREWHWDRGGKVKMSHLEHEISKLDYQGSQIPLLCCQEDESVRMADGSTKPIKDIRAGDLVLTLQGPKEVLFAGYRRLEECVEAEVWDGNGNYVGSQTHSLTHSVLSDSGWVPCSGGIHPPAAKPTRYHCQQEYFGLSERTPQVSSQHGCNQCHRSKPHSEPFQLGLGHRARRLGVGSCVCNPSSGRVESNCPGLSSIRKLRRYQWTGQFHQGCIVGRGPSYVPSQLSPGPLTSMPQAACRAVGCSSGSSQPRFFRKYAERLSSICRSFSRLLGSLLCRSGLSQGLGQSHQDHQSWLVPCACRGQQDQGSDFEESVYEHEEPRQPSLVRLPVVLHEPSLRQDRPSLPSRAVFFGEVSCALNGSGLAGYPRSCLSLLHLCGEPALWQPGSSLIASQPTGGVGRRTRMGLPSGGQDTVQKCIRPKLQYVHPYKGEERTAVEDTVLGSCVTRPCGKRWVIDLTIKGESHYITGVGLVNKNCFDELPHFSESQFWYMVSRNRSMSGVRGYVRATCNPDPDSFVAKLIEWWIDQETGFPIKERAGKIRWLLRVNDRLHWGDTGDELIQRFAGKIPDVALRPKSITFVPSKLTDNAKLMASDPGYYANLLALPTIERERLLHGNWKIRASAGLYFQRSWMKPVTALPAGTRLVRSWDLAATEKTDTNDPDFTETVLMGEYERRFFVIEHAFMQGSPRRVQQFVLNTADQDRAAGRSVTISVPQDPGQAGKAQVTTYSELLVGHTVRFSTESRAAQSSSTAPAAKAAKISRFGPFSAQCQAGNVHYLPGSWNTEFFERLEAFPEANHDDTADVCSRAFNQLIGRGAPAQFITFPLIGR